MQERAFRAMNTDVRVALNAEGAAGGRLVDAAAAEFALYERTLSRFDPASELSALNQAGPRWVFVSPLLFTALAAALQAWTQTGGLYDPAILTALEAAGYDRSFERLPPSQTSRSADGKAPAATVPPRTVCAASAPYALATQAQAVCLAPGVRLDLGGIGKGLAVDAAAARLAGREGFLVDAGGDVRVGGVSPDGGLWGVGVQDPAQLDDDLAVLALTDGAVATSSVGRRRWLKDGALQHHLIDPRTGRSAASDVRAATIIAPACATAEVWAKTVVVAGAAAGFALLAQQDLPGLAVLTDGRVLVNEAMRPFLVAGEAEPALIG